MSYRRILPGFNITLGYTLLYLSLVVLIPISAIFLTTATLSWGEFWNAVANPRVLASYRLSFGLALLAALLNGVFGTVVAWALVRYDFPGRRIVDALIDLPFALPTAVAGISLASLYSQNGWVGKWLHSSGIQIAYTPAGIFVALVFIGLPFVVRTVQPILEGFDPEIEEASTTLGAGRIQTMVRVIFPTLLPSILTGVALAFARAVGEYGSVIFIAGNMPMKSEITPLLIIIQLEQYNIPGATAIAVVMLAASFLILLLINILQSWTSRYQRS